MDASRRSIYVGLPRTEWIENKLSTLRDKLCIYFQTKISNRCDVDGVSIRASDRGDKIWMEVTFCEPSGVEHVLSNAKHELKVQGWDTILLEVRADLPPDIEPTDDGESESFVVISEDGVDNEIFLKDGGLTKEESAPKDINQSPSQSHAPPSRQCSSRNAATLHLAGVASPKAEEVPPGPHSAHHTPDPAEMSSLQSTVGTTVQGEKHYEEGTDEDLYSPNGSEKPFREIQQVPSGPRSAQCTQNPAEMSSPQLTIGTELQGEGHYEDARDEDLYSPNGSKKPFTENEVPPGPHSAHHTPNPAEMSSLQSTVGTNLQEYEEDARDEDLYSPNGSKKPFTENETPNPSKKLKTEASHSQDIANKDLHGGGDDYQKQGSSQQQPRASGDGHHQQPVESGKHGGGASQKGSLRPQQKGAAAQDQMNKQDQVHHGPQNTTKSSGPQTGKRKKRKAKGKKAGSEIPEEKQTVADRKQLSEAPSKHEEHMQEEDSSDEKEEQEEKKQFVEVTSSNQSSLEDKLQMHFENPIRSGGGDIKTWEHDTKTGAIRKTSKNPSQHHQQPGESSEHQLRGSGGIQKGSWITQQKGAAAQDQMNKQDQDHHRPQNITKSSGPQTGHHQQPGESSEHQLRGGGGVQKGSWIPQQKGAAAQDQMSKHDQDHHRPQNTTMSSGPQTSEKKQRKPRGSKVESEISEEKQIVAAKKGRLEAPSKHQEHMQEEDSPDGKEEEEEHFVEVTGFNKSSSEEMIKMHFENSRRSGGGDIKTWEHDPKTGAIRMTFENPSLASNVIARQHKLGGANLMVQLIVKKKPRPRPVKKRCLFLNGIPDGCNSELVTMFIENRSGTDEFKIQYGEEPGTALCTFTEDIQDIEKVIKRISSKVLSGAYLTAEKVKESDCILVEGVSPKASLEMIELYFDNKKKSGGTGVREVQQGPTDTQAVVYFEDWKVVGDVLSKGSPYKVGGTELLVEEYHDCLGRLSALDVPTPHVPKPVTVQVQEPIMEFIFRKGQHTKKTLIQKLRDAKAILKWPDGDDKTTARLEPLLEDGQRQPSWLKWSETSTQVLNDFLNRCKSSRIAVLPPFWKDVIDRINQLNTKNFSIQHDASTHLVTLVGEQQDVDKGCTDVNKIIKELKAKAEYEAEQTKEDILLTEEKSQPFMICGIKDKIEKDFPNLKITVMSLQDKIKLTFEGSRKIVRDAELSMRRQMDNLEKLELKTGCNKVKFVLNVIDKIHEILGSQGIRAACKGSDDGKIIISGASKKDTTQAKAYFIREIEEDVIPIRGQAAMDVLQNQTGQRLLDAINKQKFVMAAISNKGGNSVELAGFKTNLDETKQKILDFLKDNVILKKIVPANKNKICLIDKFHGADLVNVAMQNAKNHVKIQPQKSGRRKGFVIQGNEEGSEAARQAIASLVDRIKEQPYPVSKTGMAQLFRENKGKKFLESLENEYQCVIQENVQEDSDDEAEVEGGTAVRPMVSTRVLCRIALPNGFTLKVCRGDLTRQQVDCIVNAANTELKHVGGLAAAIVEAGGRVIQTECEQILSSRRRQLYVGEPVHTTSGKLPCKKVIHVAGPRWPHHRGATSIPDDDESSHEEHLLYDGVIACLKLANKLNMQSIAIPAISTGVYGFPVDLAAKQILNAVAEFCQTMPNPTLTEIHFTNNDPPTCDVFKRAVMDQFSQFQEDEDGTDVDKGSRGASWGTPVVDDVTQPAPASAPAPRFTSSGQNILTTMEGISITLKKGSITGETVDVIVNTAGTDMQLGNGAVSKAILQVAGQALQLECSTVTSTRGNIPGGEFIVTGPAALTCKKVYHCVCESYNPAASETFLKKLVLSLMEHAEQNEMLSIAIPALGTGNLNYPADVTARVMYESVLEFSSRHPNGVLKDVRFVVYDKDMKTIQCFESEIQRLLTPATPGGASGFTSSGHGRKLKKPGSSSGPTDRQAYSAIQRDDTGMLQTKIGSVCLQVGQGDLVKETTDAIVNSVGPGLALQGPVSKAILTNGGKSIAKECDTLRKKDPKKLIYWTGGGSLQCSFICHVVTPQTPEDIKTIVFKTLKQAEDKKVKSVSFPALGTGQAGQSVADCASTMLTAVGEFAVRKKPQHLRLIRLVIFQQDMVSGFQDALKSGVGTSYKEQKGLLSKGLGLMKSAWSVVSGGAAPADASTDDESLEETIILNIYAMDMSSVKRASDRIDQFQDQEYTSEDRPDEHGMIDKMTDKHRAELRAIGKKFNVIINCHNKGHAKFVKVEGCTIKVKDACIKIQELFTRMQIEELEMQRSEHLFKEVQWKYSTPHGMEAYDPEVNVIIEDAYNKKRPSVSLNLEDGQVTINFQNMQEASFAGNLNVHRVDLKKVASFELPPNWIPMDKKEHFKMAPLTAGSGDYTAVETQFQKSMGGHQIQEIHRIQNRDLMMQYGARKAAMEARLGRTNIEETLFHGTDEQTCDKINKFGFNRSFCGKNATAYGNGTYFAVNANYSAQPQYAKPNANGVQHMYLTKVLVGDYIRGNHGMITPPNKPSHPDQQYDCVVDNVNQPGIYVIFHDAQAYPEYLIKFQ